MNRIKRISASGGFGLTDPTREVMVTSSLQNVPRERPLRIGIIGLGAIAQRSHIPNFASAPNAEIVAVCDPIEEKARLVAEKWAIPRVFFDYHELLAMKELDAVSVCVPNQYHADIVVDACNAGKHVLCEKPIATSLGDAQRMIDAAHENDVTLEIALFKTFNPKYEVAKAILEEGVIGDVLTVRTKLGHAGPEGWTPATGSWYFRKSESGMGALLDLGIKHISLIRWLLNDDAVESVTGRVKTYVKTSSEVEDYAVALLNFHSGVCCILEASWCTIPTFSGTEIVGTKGTLFLDYPNTPIEVKLGARYQASFCPEVPEQGPRGNPFHRFVDSILAGKPLDVSAEEEKKSLEVAMAIYESSSSGSIIRLPGGER